MDWVFDQMNKLQYFTTAFTLIIGTKHICLDKVSIIYMYNSAMKPFQKLKLTICVPLTTAAHNKDPET